MSKSSFMKLPLDLAIEVIEFRLEMTDKDIAEELGVGFRAVRQWKTGKHVPLYRTIRPLQAIARRANVEIAPESMTR